MSMKLSEYMNVCPNEASSRIKKKGSITILYEYNSLLRVTWRMSKYDAKYGKSPDF